jgi:hypothetical protein
MLILTSLLVPVKEVGLLVPLYHLLQLRDTGGEKSMVEQGSKARVPPGQVVYMSSPSVHFPSIS